MTHNGLQSYRCLQDSWSQTEIFMASCLFSVTVPICIFIAFRYEAKCADLRTCLAVGLTFALSADMLFKRALLHNLEYVLTFEPAEILPCTRECYLLQLTVVWFVITVLCVLQVYYRTGVLHALFGGNGGNHIPLSAPNKAAEDVAATAFMQRTFSYPDALVWNYFDPDEVPELLKPHAENIFLFAQRVMGQYGFQVDNSRNQCEHLLMLLFNETSATDRIISAPALRIHRRIFVNYRKWCDSLGIKPLLLMDVSSVKSHEVLVEDVLLFLLIWGESANLRHMPECLCFLFHKTMEEHLQAKRSGSGTTFAPSGKYPGFFLDMVVTPIYEVIAKSMAKIVDHAERKIYDDFNEFFWSPNCLKYRLYDVTLTAEHAELGQQSKRKPAVESNLDLAAGLRMSSKTYLEKRSWFHPLLSVHRVFEWHVISFTLLAAWAFSDLLQWTYAFTLQTGSFVFWEITFLGLLWTCLEVWTLFPSGNISDPSVCGFLIRMLAGYLILVYQTIYFHWSFVTQPDSPLKSLALFNQGDSMFWWWQYIWLSLLSCSLYFLQSVLAWFPGVISAVMSWKNDSVQSLITVMYPISQLFVGKNTSVSQNEVWRYILFWLILLAFKLWFGYNFIVSPVCLPTLQLYDDYMNFTKTSFLKTSLLIFFWWFPHFLVYIIDLSIWYAVWSSAIGGFLAITTRLGAVRDSTTLRAHFTRAALLFEQKFMPMSQQALAAKEHLPSHLSTMSFTELTILPKNAAAVTEQTPLLPPPPSLKARSAADLDSYLGSGSGSGRGPQIDLRRCASDTIGDSKGDRWMIFGRIWNEIVHNLRESDHLNDQERDWLLFSKFEWLSKPIYLPLFQTAGGVEVAAAAFQDVWKQVTSEDDKQLKMKIIESFQTSLSSSTISAVGEAWELMSWTVCELLGNAHLEDALVLMTTLRQWFSSGDAFWRISGEHSGGMLKHITNITTLLLLGEGKRKANPIVPHDMPLNKPKTEKTEVTTASGGNIKKSVSTGFLRSLEEDYIAHQSFRKLEPFRKTSELVDKLRDKVRDELKSLLVVLHMTVKDAIKKAPISVAQPVIPADVVALNKSLTFILQLENGFFCNDVYASKNIDLLCKDPRSHHALQKLDGLLKLRITQVELRSHEANRRLNFFINSLYMDVPQVPGARFCKEYTTITPYYSEDILLTKKDLEATNTDKVSVILYLQTLYKNDWGNFLERRGIKDESLIWSSQHLTALRMWASSRAQTLYRTVEGMMHGEAAVRLLAELEGLESRDINVLAKLKFNYVVACQVYGIFKNNQDSKADDIDFLLARHPNLRVAYIDAHRANSGADMSFYSVLIKTDTKDKDDTEVKKEMQVKEVYRIKLPGNPVLGEGKPENQNHAIVFTRGRFLQAIDMNQDGYFEEALKMRNLLEEFNAEYAILGFREHIFTGTVSSVANYMALQELSFVTLGQRVLNQPLRIRQHYGHPDLFDKFFVMTEGGMSKASKGINLSEDVFAGFNATIRGHSVGFVEYVNVGKGRDVGLQQTYKFEAKLSQGNAEQSLSRDVDRICNRLDFFRLFSFYYGGIGHYLSNALVMFTLVIVVYTMLAQAVYGAEGVGGRAILPEGVLQLALAGMGILQTLPLAVTLTVEKGFRAALSEISFMILSGGPLYFIFHIQTKSYYFSQTLLAGGAMYRPTGRGFVTQHVAFDESFRFFASSHIYLGFELAVALVLFGIHTKSAQYSGLTWSLWLAAVAFLFGPFWFNPLSFEWSRISDDYYVWLRWMEEKGGSSEQSWDMWWKEENSFLHKLTISWKALLVLQKSVLWIFIAVGLSGKHIRGSEHEQLLVMKMLGVVAAYFAIRWVLGKVDKNLTYPMRRFLSLFLNAFAGCTLLYYFFSHAKYLLYSITFYYIAAALAFMVLLMGYYPLVMPIYKLHDYVVGHCIFLVLSIASVCQLGALQTSLLYHGALSKGIEIEDILQYARHNKEKAHTDSETVAELKAKLSAQDKKIQDLLELAQLQHSGHGHGGYAPIVGKPPTPKHHAFDHGHASLSTLPVGQHVQPAPYYQSIAPQGPSPSPPPVGIASAAAAAQVSPLPMHLLIGV